MPCAICNDAVSGKSDVEVWHASDIVASAEDCAFCRIIHGVFHEHDVKGSQQVHVTNDGNTSRTRATHGILLLVIEDGKQYGSQFDFVIRNLKGEYVRGVIREAGVVREHPKHVASRNGWFIFVNSARPNICWRVEYVPWSIVFTTNHVLTIIVGLHTQTLREVVESGCTYTGSSRAFD